MRVGYLGPEGTFTQAAALSAPAADEFELIACETIHDTVLAVRDGSVERAVVPIENSLEGSVNVTLDALVISHPQATAQCRDYIRANLPAARVMTASSTAEAVRLVTERIRHRWAAIGTRLAAELYDCVVLAPGIEDVSGNQTRFVWLAQDGTAAGVPGLAVSPDAAWKTAIVFWGEGTESPGWLVSCLSELAFRGVNLTRIESRPLREGLGRYMFFADLDGREADAQVLDALSGLRARVNVLRTLGSFPVA
jgi:prephenate dehydratase